MQQNKRDVTEYYMEMITLWQELDMILEERWVCKEDSVLHKSKLESKKVFEFLARLNHKLDEVRGRIRGRQSLTTREVFEEIFHKEKCWKIMLTREDEVYDPLSVLISQGSHEPQPLNPSQAHSNCGPPKPNPSRESSGLENKPYWLSKHGDRHDNYETRLENFGLLPVGLQMGLKIIPIWVNNKGVLGMNIIVKMATQKVPVERYMVNQ